MKKKILLIFAFIPLLIFANVDFDESIQEAKSYWDTNPQKSIEISRNALQIAKSENDERMIAQAYQTMGNSFWHLDNYQKAIEAYLSCVELRKTFSNKLPLSRTYNSLGIAYKNLSDFDNSIKYHELSLKIREQYPDDELIAASLNNLGSTFLKKHDYQNSLNYYLRSIDVKQKANLPMTNAYTNVGLIYTKLNDYQNAEKFYQKALELSESANQKSYVLTLYGNLFLEQQQYPQALQKYQKAAEYRQKMKNDLDLSASYQNIGIVYKRMKDYAKALNFHRKALEIRKKNNSQKLIALSLSQIGEVYLEQNQGVKALNNFVSAEKMYKQLADIDGQIRCSIGKVKSYKMMKMHQKAIHSLDILINLAEQIKSDYFIKFAYELLQQIEAEKGNYEEAYLALQKYSQMEAKINKQNNDRIISEMRSRFELQEEQRENNLLRIESQNKDLQIKNQNILRNSLLIFIVLLLIFTIYIFYQFRKNQKTNRLLNEKNKEIAQQKQQLMESLNNLSEKQNEILKLEKQNSVMAMAITANHEINQPLMVMKGNLELLQMTIDPEMLNEKQKKFLEKINSSIENISNLLDKYKNIKEFSYEKYTHDEDMVKY